MVTKIMPLGASNTYGMSQNPSSLGGYRGPLQDLLRGEGRSFDLVGLDKDGRIDDASHNGYPGRTIDWFTRPVDQAIRDRDGDYSHTIDSGSQTAVRYFIDKAGLASDDVILLLAGTNDVRAGDSPQTMLSQMKVLLDQIVSHAASPLVQLMKLQPVGGDFWKNDGSSRTNNDTIRAFNDGLERLVDEKYGALGVTLVDGNVGMADLSSDGVHMNAAGYRDMAAAWFDSLMDEDQVDGRSGNPPVTPTPSAGGDDVITVRVSGDAWEGDPNFALLVNGRTVDATSRVTADRADGEWDTFTFHGDFGLDGSDRVGIRFTNDHYEGRGRDRNLHVDEVRVNGERDGTNQSLYSNGTETWDF